MTFYKYRHKWSSGWGEWEYVEVNTGNIDPNTYIDLELRPELQEYNNLVHGLEGGYRGVEIEVVACPPRDWLEAELEAATDRIEHAKKRIERYTALLPESVPRPRCTECRTALDTIRPDHKLDCSQWHVGRLTTVAQRK